jgi:hypothetical protein
MDGTDTVVALIATPFFFALNGWVALTLWRWFLVPLGAPTLTFGQVLGANLLIGYVFYRKGENKWASERDFYADVFALPVVRALLTLLCAVIVRGIFL